MKVHNHGPDEGRGLNCPEISTPWGPQGACIRTRQNPPRVILLDATPDELPMIKGKLELAIACAQYGLQGSMREGVVEQLKRIIDNIEEHSD
jgi:hypothetical protein